MRVRAGYRCGRLAAGRTARLLYAAVLLNCSVSTNNSTYFTSHLRFRSRACYEAVASAARRSDPRARRPRRGSRGSNRARTVVDGRHAVTGEVQLRRGHRLCPRRWRGGRRSSTSSTSTNSDTDVPPGFFGNTSGVLTGLRAWEGWILLWGAVAFPGGMPVLRAATPAHGHS